ncbi:DNA topoisomerase VI, subunit A [Clostridium aceticum]|uniref:DNA topoisomerase VI, subunit A n=1 Tax=Clostridium aceticum TaxID=84022 RepID=A0A0D8I8G9_9CLOT|nr:ATP-binding protein [Clostridium aceticum]AKL96164.1 DNA topoisomerase VI, subunit A [Clostridium aceticum]KJF26585.1 hypothetical protein TZ02_11965 [Clostridium aceticum]
MNFTREDWTLFRNMDTLPQKSGVAKHGIPKLVAKELTDNALDISDKVEIEGNYRNFTVWNDGDGIDPEKLGELFSINRPMVSSKLLRLPTRGALGNGLRVVAGAVIATGGKLYVSTHGHKYEILPQDNGTSDAIVVDEYDRTGTKIEVSLGDEYIDFKWAEDAVKFNKGTKYKGKTSAYWYNSETFFELLQATDSTVREVVEQFDGCSSTKAGKIAREYGRNRKSNELSFDESEQLLNSIRQESRPVKAARLGEIGELEGYSSYNKQSGTFALESTKGNYNAKIPFTVEVFTKEADKSSCQALINKSPSIKGIHASESNKKLNIWGSGFDIYLKCTGVEIVININTPYMPITNDGKEPNYRLMAEVIEIATTKAVNSYKRNSGSKPTDGSKRLTQKDVMLNNLNEAVKKASGDGTYRFSQRQLFYGVRPYVMEQLGIEPTYENFNKVITDYEAEHGDIEGIYRDSRGSLYTPHSGTTIPIGTLSVENYQRPEWTFNKVLYIEKEGFFEILKDVKFPERYDCALLTGKGYASRAVKDLIDYLGESQEELTVFCIHDCDKAGTVIYETLQQKTKSRGERKVNIIDLGLNPKEAIEMGLDVEKPDKKKKMKAADYLTPEEKAWLETNRVELNAMTTPQFIDWLERKMHEYDNGKVVPVDEVLKDELLNKVRYFTKSKVRERILQENNYEKQYQQEVISLQSKIEEKELRLKEMVIESLAASPEQIWKQPIESIAKEIV